MATTNDVEILLAPIRFWLPKWTPTLSVITVELNPISQSFSQIFGRHWTTKIRAILSGEIFEKLLLWFAAFKSTIFGLNYLSFFPMLWEWEAEMVSRAIQIFKGSHGQISFGWLFVTWNTGTLNRNPPIFQQIPGLTFNFNSFIKDCKAMKEGQASPVPTKKIP